MENIVDENVIGEELSPKQELFCRNYTQNYDLMGNKTLSYADAYGIDLDSLSEDDEVYEFEDGSTMTKGEYESLWEVPKDKKHYRTKEKSSWKKAYDNCSSMSSRLSRNVKIQARMIVLTNEFMRDEIMDKRLTEIALKGEHRDSIQAIKEYNKLKSRITEKKDITSGGKTIAGFNFVRAEEPEKKLPTPNILSQSPVEEMEVALGQETVTTTTHGKDNSNNQTNEEATGSLG